MVGLATSAKAVWELLWAQNCFSKKWLQCEFLSGPILNLQYRQEWSEALVPSMGFSSLLSVRHSGIKFGVFWRPLK